MVSRSDSTDSRPGAGRTAPRAPAPAYGRAELAAALRAVGVARGDTVFVHACLDALAPVPDAADAADRAAMVHDALRDVIGVDGTLLVPTYSFSFCRNEPFDVQRTPALRGPWSTSLEFVELVRRHPDAVRSHDPIHSVAGIGPRASELVSNVPNTCFGVGSVFERLRHAGAKIVMLGAPLEEATIRHHTEELAAVPFRYRKLFTGEIRDGARVHRTGWIYFVRILADNGYPDGNRLEQCARDAGVCRAAPLGGGEVLAVEAEPYHRLATRLLTTDPWFTARGPAGDPEELENARVAGPRFDVQLPPNATMDQMIDRIWTLPRHLVSDAYDAALAALATQLPMTIRKYPTGSECWTWFVPEKWTCHEAYLETLDGRRLFSYADHPLHVVSYSLPFEGEVSREELMRHLHVHPRLPDATPFILKYYERDWGLCCSRTQRDALLDDRYRVVIRASFSYTTLKVGDAVVRGATDDEVVLCAHLDHAHMVNDDLTGVMVGIDVMRALARRTDLRYTYRLLILPETIGSVAYLSRAGDLIPKMRAGLFLEMLGRDHPHSLQLSFDGRTEADRCFTMAMKEADPFAWTGPFRTLVGNDERQFNAPGVRVPMLSLSRIVPATAPDLYYREYHSSEDTPDRVPRGALEESRDVVLRMIDALESNRTPVNQFQGEPFCSRYGIHVDAYANPEGNRALFDMLFLIDGTRSVADIAEQCAIPFSAARDALAELHRHGLITYTS